ncbi:MAG: helix-turn-helix transcriptional regulator [Actinomycetota bacterium]|nr:helix-turn-helix transcriptional regulator [Actinomycetota bacterium]
MDHRPRRSEPTEPEPLWREVTGRVLRRARHDRGERLVETAARAGVSSQYLSELERGRKDASSELLVAVAGALDLTLFDLTRAVATELARASEPAPVPVLRAVTGGPRVVPVPEPVRDARGPMALAA